MAVVAALSLTGCGQQTQQAEQPQLVKAIQVGSERAGTTAGTYSGTVKGRYQSNLSFQAGGRITARNVQLGSQVHAGDVLMTVDPKDIAQAVNQTQAKVDAAAAQLQLAQSNLNRYQQLYDMDAISASVLDQYQQAADVVREVAPMADAASRTYQVNISLPNPPDGMQLGMTATVANGSEQAAAEDTFVLPLAAIYQTGDTPQVWVVGEDKTLSLKDVTVQDFGDNSVKVTGLNRGDIVVTAGVHQLREGQKVRVEGEDE